jgi:multiple sugar transport system permease protein
MKPNLAARLGGYAALIFVCALFAFPMYWMLKGSVESTQDLLRGHLLPAGISLDNYGKLSQQPAFRTYFLNSLLVSVCTTVLSTAFAALAGYGLARFQFRGKTLVSRGVLFCYMFPSLAIAIPLFGIFHGVGLGNTRTGLVLAHITLSLPFGIWLMWQYFQTIPVAFRVSAALLGPGRLRTFIEVEMPLARSGLIAVAIFAFALSWEDYEFVFVLITSEAAKTLTVGMTQFGQRDFIQWGLIMGASVLMAIPAFLLISFLQKYLVAGLGSGGLKG